MSFYTSKYAPQDLGTLFDYSAYANTSMYTNTGSVNATVSNGEMTITGGSSNFLKYLTATQYGTTALMYWDYSVIFRPQTTSSGGDVFFMGILGDTANSPRTSVCALVVNTGASNGEVRMYRGNGSGTIVATSAQKLVYSLNDRIQLTYSRSGFTYTVTATNLTTGTSTVSASYTVSNDNLANYLHFSGKFVLYAYSGTQIFERHWATSTAKKFGTVFVGDSKTEGASVSTFAATYPSLAFVSVPNKMARVAKINNTTADVLNSLHEVLRLKPKYAVINLGRNDLGFGVLTATWQANYASIVSQLKNAGIVVIHLMPIPETVQSQTTLTSYINSTYPNDLKIDVSGFNTATMLAADNIHPNSTGMTYIASQITAQQPLLLY